MYFRRFRSELGAFLQRYQLPENVIDDDRWPGFLHLYILAVQSSPLKYEPPNPKKNDPVAPLPDVQHISVSLLDFKPAGAGDFRLMFVWDWPNVDDNFPIGVRRVLTV